MHSSQYNGIFHFPISTSASQKFSISRAPVFNAAWFDHMEKSLAEDSHKIFLQREFESLATLEKDALRLPHSLPSLYCRSQDRQTQAPTQTNRTERNQTSNHINITMCAHFLPFAATTPFHFIQPSRLIFLRLTL